MQIVIDIPEDVKAKIDDNINACELDIYDCVMIAVKNGTPLPKGHGRLGDLDALEKEIVNGIKAGNYEEGYETFAHINNMDDCIECVKYADTIVEADKEQEDWHGKYSSDEKAYKDFCKDYLKHGADKEQEI